jgi:hypothetical protein
MLNDLLSIEQGLSDRGVAVVARHPDVKDMAKGWALRVRLTQGGEISSVEIIEEAGNGAVWTLRDGQHNGFPGLKTALRDRIIAKQRVSMRELLLGSVQIWAHRIERLGLDPVAGRDEIFWWPYAYDPAFLGYMEGALRLSAISEGATVIV